MTSRLKGELPDYPTQQSIRGISVAFSLGLGASEEEHGGASGAEPGVQSTPNGSMGADLGWLGVRATSGNGLQIANFTRDSFSFSRLKPYEDWSRFSDEAVRLWTLHQGVSGVSQVHRLGVRYINRLEVPIKDLGLGDYFEGLGSPPAGLPTTGFLQRYSFAVPDEPYGVNLVRTFQPPTAEAPQILALLLDVDAFASEPFPARADIISQHLTRLRTLKNQMFFGSLTRRALELCR